MNLFRSEEHVKAWDHYDAASEEGIMSAEEWAQVFSGPLFRNRLEPDYLSKQLLLRSDLLHVGRPGQDRTVLVAAATIDLDAMRTSCSRGDYGICDLLFYLSPFGSEHEEVAATCGGTDAGDHPGFCTRRYGLGRRS